MEKLGLQDLVYIAHGLMTIKTNENYTTEKVELTLEKVMNLIENKV